MNKIITVTLNPAIDRITSVPDFHVGAVQKADAAHVYPAGKGVNVARTLSCLGHDVIAIGVIGKGDVEFFETIRWSGVASDPAAGKILTDWIQTETPTRTNNTFLDPVRSTETHIREVIRTDEPFPLTRVEESLRQHCGKGDVVVFAGSLPTNATEDTLTCLIGLCRSMGARVILDSSGEALKNALTAGPDLIKPNVQELEEVIGHRFYTRGEIVAAARELARTYGIHHVLVSMGEEGAILVSDETEELPALQAVFMLRLSQKQLHTVGSGDAMVAAVAAVLAEDGKPRQMLIEGTAAGVANLLTEGPGIVSADKVKRLRDAVEVGEFH